MSSKQSFGNLNFGIMGPANWGRFSLVAAVVAIGGGSAMAQTGAGAAREALERDFPDVVLIERGEQVRTVLGRPMTTGATPREAMEDWMFRYGEVFGVDELEWVESRAAEISRGRVAFALPQEVTVEGGILPEPTRLRVEDGRLRALVAPVGENFAVTYVSARVKPTSGGIAPPLITGAQAIAAAERDERTSHLKVWHDPELVVVEMDLGMGDEVFAAWRIGGMEAEGAIWSTLIVHVDAATGEVVRVESGVSHSDVTGTVDAKVTAGLGPPVPNAITIKTLPDLIVSIVGEDSTLTDENGAYELDTASATVDVEASLDAGHWTVFDGASVPPTTPVLSQQGVNPPASGEDFRFNDVRSPSQAETAPSNAFLHLQMTNAFFGQRVANWESLLGTTLPALNVTVNVNCCAIGGEHCCRGNYDHLGPGLWFCTEDADPVAGRPCNNAGYSTIISHEYGHYIHHFIIGESPTAAGPKSFGEGFSDSLAMLVHNTGVFAQGFYTDSPPTYIREPSMADITYPACSAQGDVWTRGQLLGRIWWDIRTTIKPDPPVEPIDAVRDLFVDWTMMTNGSAPPPDSQCTGTRQPADEGTLLEVLIADDVDGILGNGTPNEEAICAAFAARGIFIVSGNYGVCNESAGGGSGCRVDFTGDGVLDFFDFVEFQNLFAAGDPQADLTDDGSLDFFDFIAFGNEFAAGCR